MSQGMTKSTKWHVHLARTQVSLGVRPVWSVFAVRMKKAWVLSQPLRTQQRFWSDWADAQADESSLGAHAMLLVLLWGGPIPMSLFAAAFCET